MYKSKVILKNKCSLSSLKRLWYMPLMVYLPMATSILKESMMAQEAIAEVTTKFAASDVGVSSPTGLLSSILKIIHELYLRMDVARLAPGLVKILIDLGYCLTLPSTELCHQNLTASRAQSC